MQIAALRRFLAAVCVASFAASCTSEDPPPELLPYDRCQGVAECRNFDDRYDACSWVCAGDITYCRVSCETPADCVGVGLPEDHVYCDIPRPGDGFCNPYGFDYKDGACEPNPGESSPPGGNDDEPQQCGFETCRAECCSHLGSAPVCCGGAFCSGNCIGNPCCS